MTTLAAFLAERLDEDEAVALAATPGGWHHSDAHGSCVVTADRQSMIADLSPEGGSWRGQWSDAAHIARHDPARVLAEVAAKRAVLAACEDERQRKDIYNRGYDEGLLTTDGDRRSRLSSNARWAGLDLAVRFMVQVYSDHADFRPEWLPENW